MYECLCVRFTNAGPNHLYPELIGECIDGEATVSLYVEDASIPPGDHVPIPSMCHPMEQDPPGVKRVAYHFRLPCNTPCVEPDESSSAPTEPSLPSVPPTSAPTQLSDCDKSVVVEYEDFESGTHDNWNQGLVSYDPALSYFLGRFGKGNTHADKVYTINPQASSASIEFILYEIDNWERVDKIAVIINSERIDLGQFYANDLSSNPFNYESGSKGGILWLRYSITPAMKVAFNNTHPDQAHKVEMHIPPSYYSSGTLSVEFRVTMSNDIEEESAGIDNIKVVEHGLCASSTSTQQSGGPGRLLDQTQMKVELAQPEGVDEPNWEGEDAGPYCGAKEFPCKGDNNVYICHYNPHLGYQTFCVAEEESDIVKFYVNSYCGPCVGGFGGKWHT